MSAGTYDYYSQWWPVIPGEQYEFICRWWNGFGTFSGYVRLMVHIPGVVWLSARAVAGVNPDLGAGQPGDILSGGVAGTERFIYTMPSSVSRVQMRVKASFSSANFYYRFEMKPAPRVFNSYLQLPVNTSLGYGAVINPVYPLSSLSTTSINVSATTITFPGQTISLGSATISGLSAGTIYTVFLDLETSSYIALASGTAPYFANPSRYIAFGTQSTQNGGGGYASPPAPPGGGGGGGGTRGDYVP